MTPIDLSGGWQLTLDPDNRDLPPKGSPPERDHSVPLPGSLPEHGIGNLPTVDSPWVGMIGRIQDEEWLKPKYAPYRTENNFRMPFWLQPPTVYAGVAWYRKEVVIPPEWAGRHIELFLERPHWETRVWVDDQFAGANDSLSVPHVTDLSDLLPPGTHTLTVRVGNRMVVDVGKNAHSISDHTQGNWNGIVGRMELIAKDPVRVEQVRVFPDIQTRSVRVEAEIAGPVPDANLHWSVTGPGVDALEGEVSVSGSREIAFEVTLGEEARLWEEFAPNVYTLNLTLGGQPHTTRFGLRDFRQQGTQFTINGRPLLLRGTLECCVFPHTGYPPTDPESWRSLFQACRDHGLNHIRFHSWCPPEAAFDVADSMGLYLQAECASWANQGATIGDGRPLDTWLYEEGRRIVAAYGNHPSFVMMAYGNEPGGEYHADYLREWVTYWKSHDPRRVHTGAAGWPELAENEFQNIPQPRLQRWGEGLESRINRQPPETVSDYRDDVAEHSMPIVSHEIGQWCVYPNFDEIGKYTGVMKPRNFEIFRDFLSDAGLADQARDFLMASGRLQVLAYKEEIEASLRTDGFGGFQLLSLSDFPGQGTALVGVLDAFWEAKPYLEARKFRQFCAPIVPLARLPKRVFTPGEPLETDIEIAHFGPEDLNDACVVWELLNDDGITLTPPLQGILRRDLRCGKLNKVDRIRVPLDDLQAPSKLTLRVRIEETDAMNSWDLWVFPEASPLTEDPRIVRELDHQAFDRLNQGETLWLMADPHRVRTEIALGFSPIFWNTAWTHNQPPHTLGLLCDPGHPALSEFPTEFHSNWQWWHVVSNAATMELPSQIRPLIQVVPDWFSPQCLGLAFEVRVGNGRLLVTSIDLAAGGPVGCQLFRSLLAYLNRPPPLPEQQLEPEQIRELFTSEA